MFLTIGGTEHYRPRIEVRLQHGEKQFHTAMIVDSGADVSLIPAQVAEVLELDLGESTRSIGAAGKFSDRPSEVELYYQFASCMDSRAFLDLDHSCRHDSCELCHIV